MSPDPDTSEGMKEIERRLQKQRKEAAEARRQAVTDIEDEPTGKLTEPSELDLRRDRRGD